MTNLSRLRNRLIEMKSLESLDFSGTRFECNLAQDFLSAFDVRLVRLNLSNCMLKDSLLESKDPYDSWNLIELNLQSQSFDSCSRIRELDSSTEA